MYGQPSPYTLKFKAITSHLITAQKLDYESNLSSNFSRLMKTKDAKI